VCLTRSLFRIAGFCLIGTVLPGSWYGSRCLHAAQPEVTQHDVLPFVLLRCTACHGRLRQEGGLDLRSKASMLKGGKSGPAIVLGDPENSLVIQRVLAEEMPPRKRLIAVSVKPMEPGEIELLRTWIAAGAPEIEGDQKPPQSEPAISDQDRQFWSFQPPVDPSLPQVQHVDRMRNLIDAFILQKLEKKGLEISPAADPGTLLRRVVFDLTGLPPDIEQVAAFVKDNRPDAYERRLDALLASRRYGERWGGYWLDAAGYADTEGEREQDILRRHAYRYRDYVIRAFNEDKPYDRFLREQLAGDELVDYESAAEITQEIYDNLVATGFLRMAPDPTWFDVTGFVPNRLDVIADAVDVLGSAVMGLTIKCARCHTHKFDPILHRDYYALTAILKGAYDEHDWIKPNSGGAVNSESFRYLPHVLPGELQEWKSQESSLSTEIASLKETLQNKAEQLKKKYFEDQVTLLPEVLRTDIRQALETPPAERNEIQKYLSEKFEKELTATDEQLKAMDENFRKVAEETDQQVTAVEKKRRPEPMIRALWDRGVPSPTYVLRRGNYLTPGGFVVPAVPTVFVDGKPLEFKPPWQGANKTGRRLALANWLVESDNPLTARVMVNRIWKHHFQHGIVKTMGNFGRTGSLPSHPELLDHLARELVRRQWGIKSMHRLIMTSSTYRQSSTVTPENEQLDLDNDLLSRFPMKRMEAEVLWDTLLSISERLDETPFGPADGVNVRADGLVTAVPTEQGWRRSVYVEHNRKQNLTILESFDLPRPRPNCLERKQSTVATQALHLLNNQMIYELATLFARRVVREVGTDEAKQIERSYQIALARLPRHDEKQLAMETLDRLKQEWKGQDDVPDVRALADLCHVLINTAEFIYID